MIFITGMFRSGTTLLSRMLHAHRDIKIAYDVYLPFFHSLKMKIAKDIGVNINGTYADIDRYFYPVNDYYFSGKELLLFNQIQSTDLYHRISVQELTTLKAMIYEYGERFEPLIVSCIGVLNGDSYEKVYISMLSLIRKAYKDNKSIIGFKDAWADEFIPALIKTFPNIKIIQIIRDPRAICASKNYSKKTKPYPWIFITRRWRKHALLYLHYKNRYDNNLMSIKYEELVSHPEHISKNICNFLGVEFDKNMLKTKQFTNGNGEEWLQNTSFQVNDGFSMESIFKWMEILKTEEIKFIEKMCFPEMLLTGYNISYDLDTNLSMNPPIIPEDELSEWVKHYYPINKTDTIIEMGKEFLRNKLLFIEKEQDKDIIERCFLLLDFYSLWIEKRHNISKLKLEVQI